MALTQVSTNGIADGAVTANDLENSGVTAGTYGSSSAIPAITVDAKGRVTSATTNSVTQVGGANGVDFNDNVKARFGTDNDLEIYHNGSNSYVADSGTGVLALKSDGAGVHLLNGAETEYLARFNVDSGCFLYHDNALKLETTSSGIDVTGTVTTDGLTSDGNITAGVTSGAALVLKDTNSTGSASVMYMEGVDSNNSQNWYLGTAVNTSNHVYVRNQSSADIVFGTNGGDKCRIESAGHFSPEVNNSYDIGTSSLRWRNIYTNDLNLSNEGSTNDVDGTWGSWTIQEGEDDLFLLNRRNGKKYKFNLSEVN